MVNLNLLNEIIDNSGITKTYIASKMGISRAHLYDLLTGKVIFTIMEASMLCDILHITTTSERLKIFTLKLTNSPT